MAKENRSKTIWIVIVSVIAGIVVIGLILAGLAFYILFKNGTAEKSSSSTTTSTKTQTLKSYSNARYGFTIKYPSSLSASESQNGDGITLTSASPALTVRAYASNNVLSQSLNEYLNWVRDNLFKEQTDAKEIVDEELTLGGLSAKERVWSYTNSVNGSATVLDQVTTLKNNVFYTLEMVSSEADSETVAVENMFADILESYQIN